MSIRWAHYDSQSQWSPDYQETVSAKYDITRSMTYQEVSMTYQEVRMTYQEVRMTYQEASMTYQEVSMTYQEVRMTYQEVSMTYQEVSMTYQGVRGAELPQFAFLGFPMQKNEV